MREMPLINKFLERHPNYRPKVFEVMDASYIEYKNGGIDQRDADLTYHRERLVKEADWLEGRLLKLFDSSIPYTKKELKVHIASLRQEAEGKESNA